MTNFDYIFLTKSKSVYIFYPFLNLAQRESSTKSTKVMKFSKKKAVCFYKIGYFFSKA